MNEREKIVWLARRAGFGLAPGQLDVHTAKGAAALLDTLVDPDTAGVPPSPNPFAGLVEINEPDNAKEREQRQLMVASWIDHMVSTPRQLEEMMTWFWHDHFAVQISVVRSGRAMGNHINLLRKHSLGNFRTLIRDITTDPAMLVYLDGAKSTAKAPNENYGRELLELYTMGIGNYTEADVRAAAVALTGWTVRIRQGADAVFQPRLHDATPQTLLGKRVSDVESVVNTAVEHPATAQNIAGKIATWFLGVPPAKDQLASYANTFTSANFELRPLVKAVLIDGLAGAGAPVVLGPTAWWIATRRATGANPNLTLVMRLLESAGQLPGSPPNVGGWPAMAAWLGASPTASRVSLASLVADNVDAKHATLAAAAKGDHMQLANALGLPAFGASTLAGLSQIGNCGRRPGSAVLALALASPEALVA